MNTCQRILDLKLIDANVVIYAQGVDHEYRETSLRAMGRVRAGTLEATLDVEGIQEIVHYYHKRGNLEFTVAAFDRLIRGFPDAFPIDLATARQARDILAANPFLQMRDAVHAAVVFQHRLEGIISADRAFDRVPGLKRFDPKELAA